MPTAEILSQGDEIVTGQTVDSNAAWIATWLTALGVQITRHHTAGDHLPTLVEVISHAAGRCDLCVCTGGLGPTADDLTAEAVAEAFDLPLDLDEHALSAILARYDRAGRPMPAVNRKQALLPRGARRLDNDWGTAPGFAVDYRGTLLCFLPGVPREMRAMIAHRVEPLVHERLHVSRQRLLTLRTTGVGESDLQARINGTDGPPELPEGAVLGFRTTLPENHVKVRFPPKTPNAALVGLARELASRIGSPLFSIEGLEDGSIDAVDAVGGPLEQVVGRALAARAATVACAESCTGGRVAAVFTSVAGSSSWFREGVVAYSNEAKVRLVGVQAATLDAHGAVSEAVARELAEGVRARAGTTFGLSTTGIAGPGGGSTDKPVGTVHIALATPTVTHHRMLRLLGDRHRVQILAASSVIDLLRLHLQPLL